MNAPPSTLQESPATGSLPPLSRPLRWLLKAVAVTSLALGIVGAFVPVLPTVPFVLLAAWAAARSSPGLSYWLETHPRMGPMIRDWRHSGVVRRRAKWMASLMMAASAVAMALFVRPWWLPAMAGGIMVVVAAWLWQRPETIRELPADSPPAV